jgi:hypothetical protein
VNLVKSRRRLAERGNNAEEDTGLIGRMSSVSFFRFLLRFFQFFVGIGPGGDDDMLEASAPVAGLPACLLGGRRDCIPIRVYTHVRRHHHTHRALIASPVLQHTAYSDWQPLRDDGCGEYADIADTGILRRALANTIIYCSGGPFRRSDAASSLKREEAVEWKAVVVHPCCCSHILVVFVGSPPESGGVTAATVARGAGVKVKVGSRFDSDHAPVQAYPVPRQFTPGPGDYQAATRAPIRSDRARA